MFDINDNEFDSVPFEQSLINNDTEYIEKSKKLLEAMLTIYQNSFKDHSDDDRTCQRCNGFLYIEQGGYGDVDCPSCNGTGKNMERVFDIEAFSDAIEHQIIFGNHPFFELMNYNIK